MSVAVSDYTDILGFETLTPFVTFYELMCYPSDDQYQQIVNYINAYIGLRLRIPGIPSGVLGTISINKIVCLFELTNSGPNNCDNIVSN